MYAFFASALNGNFFFSAYHFSAVFKTFFKVFFSECHRCEREVHFGNSFGVFKIPFAVAEFRKMSVACRGNKSVTQEKVHFNFFLRHKHIVHPVFVNVSVFAVTRFGIFLAKFAV